MKGYTHFTVRCCEAQWAALHRPNDALLGLREALEQQSAFHAPLAPVLTSRLLSLPEAQSCIPLFTRRGAAVASTSTP